MRARGRLVQLGLGVDQVLAPLLEELQQRLVMVRVRVSLTLTLTLSLTLTLLEELQQRLGGRAGHDGQPLHLAARTWLGSGLGLG